jgi:hypothetical protein
MIPCRLVQTPCPKTESIQYRQRVTITAGTAERFYRGMYDHEAIA